MLRTSLRRLPLVRPLLRTVPRLVYRPLAAPSQLLHRFQSTVTPPAAPPLAARLRLLFRTHGWSALSIYLLLSLLDFSLTFLLILSLGADKVTQAEDYVLEVLGWRRKGGGKGQVRRVVDGWRGKDHNPEPAVLSEREHTIPSPVVAPGSNYSAWATTAVLAYAIHKTLLLPVRIGLTVAVTPRIVRTLQLWGCVLFPRRIVLIRRQGGTSEMRKLGPPRWAWPPQPRGRVKGLGKQHHRRASSRDGTFEEILILQIATTANHPPHSHHHPSCVATRAVARARRRPPET